MFPSHDRGGSSGTTYGTPSPFPGMPAAGSGPSASTGSTGSGTGHSHNMSATFTGDSTSVVQPYLAVIYIIKT